MNESVQKSLDFAQTARDSLDDSAAELSRVEGYERGRAMILAAYTHVGEAMEEIRRAAEENKES